MKLRIRGELDIKTLGEAFIKTMQHIEFCSENQYIKGATIYFNVYDKETNEVILAKDSDGYIIDEVEWITPFEQERRKYLASLKKSKKKRIGA